MLAASEGVAPRVERVLAFQVCARGKLGVRVSRSGASPTCHGCDVAVLMDVRGAAGGARE